MKTKNRYIDMQITFEKVNGSGEVYLDVLKTICGDPKGKSMADMGCNLAPYTCQLGFEKRVYVDILHRQLDDHNEQKYFVQQDALDFLKNTDTEFDVCVSSDHIEHLTDMDGTKLLILMEDKSLKQVLFTPLGDHMVETDNYNPEAHHSGWTPELVPDYACIIFPDYHPSLGIGAFFFFKCDDLEIEFERVVNELKQKEWAKN